MPAVSVVMPAYNRRQTIRRAVASVIDQTFRDWELLLVDDGSTDGTAEVVAGMDPRVRVLRQENRGAYSARNTGLAAATGEQLSFLDSDDAWLPHFLELCVCYLRAHPGAAFVATEFWQDDEAGGRTRQDWEQVTVAFPRLARSIGSSRFRGAVSDGDPYLRVYSSREALGDWAPLEALRRVGLERVPYAYRGFVADAFRWGYLLSLWCLVARREAVSGLGPFPEERRSATDYAWLHRLCTAHEAHMLSVPSVNKGVLPKGTLASPHLASQANAASFNDNLLHWFCQCFGEHVETDREIRQLLGYRHLAAARAALDRGEGARAVGHLAEASRRLPGWSEPMVLSWMVRLIPEGRALRAVYRRFRSARLLLRRVSDRAHRT